MKLMIPETAALSEAPESADVLSYTTSECVLGQVLVARSTKGICAILMGDDGEGLLADLGARFPQATLVANGISVQDDLAKVLRFLEQPVDGLHLTLDMRGTSFQRRVWEKLRSISVGRTVTYSELARWISPPASPRAVAGACAATAGASSANVNSSRRKPWHEALFVHDLLGHCGCVRRGTRSDL
jgi:AraC family transcriptional regulator, regulatory protein of adaptative response / methylated-DNA-[protein]-cysteine methyltransferase